MLCIIFYYFMYVFSILLFINMFIRIINSSIMLKIYIYILLRKQNSGYKQINNNYY